MFLKDANSYLFDEVTSALDASSEQKILANLKQLLADRTALIIAHRFTFFELVDRVFVFADGAMVEEGTVEQLLERRGMFYGLY